MALFEIQNLCIFFGKIYAHIFCPFWGTVYYYWVLRILYLFWIQDFYQLHDLQIPSPSGDFLHSLNNVLRVVGAVNCDQDHFIVVSFMNYALDIVSKKSLPNSGSQLLSPVPSSRTFRLLRNQMYFLPPEMNVWFFSLVYKCGELHWWISEF